MVPGHRVLGTCWHGHPCSRRVGLAHNRSWIDVAEVREQLGGQETSALRYVSYMGWGVPPNRPLVGGVSCFSMGRVKSGWLSKFQDLNCSR